MKKKIDLTGQKFGRLTVISEAEKRGYERMWLCRCECGVEKEIMQDNLRGGHTQSCGCFHKEQVAKKASKHGMANDPIHILWRSINDRCKPTNKHTKDYYDRNIHVCDSWKNSFWSFYWWCKFSGYKKGLQIDRKNNDKGYSPDNCRFVTNRQNSLNKRRIRSDNKSGYEGVYWHKKLSKWHTRIMIEGQHIHLGRYEELEDAVNARNDYILKKGLQKDYKVQVI